MRKNDYDEGENLRRRVGEIFLFVDFRLWRKSKKATFHREIFLYFLQISLYLLVTLFIFIFLAHMTELYEKSAGGIVYRKKGNHIEILMLAWKNARDDLEYVLPKGHIENDESPMETALREISEET